MPEHSLRRRGVAQSETANQERSLFGDEGADSLAVLGRPACGVDARLDPQQRRFAGLEICVQCGDRGCHGHRTSRTAGARRPSISIA